MDRQSPLQHDSRRIDDVVPVDAEQAHRTALEKPEVHHIAVAEPVEVKTKYSPLSSYIDSSKYFNPDAPVAPKRPLGAPRQPEPVFYERMPGYMDAGPAPAPLVDRIRRPNRAEPRMTREAMTLTAATAGAALTTHAEGYRRSFAKAGAAIAAFFILMKDHLVSAKDFAADKLGHIRAFSPRVHYTAFQGAVVRKFGMRESWSKLAVPLFLTACLLALAIFNDLLGPGSTTFNPSGSESSSNGSSSTGGNGASNKAGQTGSGTGTGTGTTVSPQNAPSSSSNQVQGTAGGQLQSPQAGSGGTGGTSTGGRGAGSSAGSTIPTTSGGTTNPIISTGSNTPSEALPTPGGTGSVLPNTPLPLPITVTVPPNNTSAGGKTIVDTSGTTITVN